MSARAARFEIVRTTAGWHARFVASNGKTVWVTESYRRRRAALEAIVQITKPVAAGSTDWPMAVWVYNHGAVEVREADER